jgi:hypothetical protein
MAVVNKDLEAEAALKNGENPSCLEQQLFRLQIVSAHE